MGIFSRIADVFKANVNDALDNAEDPEKMLKQMVIEMEESVNKATLAIANSIDSADWLYKAQQAVTAGREDLARAALEKKAIQDKNISDLEPIYLIAKSTSDKLRTQLDALKHKLDEARARQGTLIARSQAAKAQKQIAQTFSGVGSDAFSKFDKFETKIETLESQAEAFEQLAGQSTSLDDEFKKLTSSSQVEQQLLELKASMGKLPSASKDALPPHQE